jgi:predicted ATPase/DNA-binding SARP family transcriptional activator
MAILAYLAVTGTPHGRDTLATLFWADASQSRARGNLRRALSDLKREAGEGILLLEGENVATVGYKSIWLDVARFRDLMNTCATHAHPSEEVCSDCFPLLEEAINLYQADFMTGFTLRNTLEFDDWQYFESVSLRQEIAKVLERLVKNLSVRGDFDSAIPFARRWLALDMLHEPAQYALVQLYYQTGKLSTALRQFDQYREILNDEMGVPPGSEILSLYESIKVKRVSGLEEKPVHNLPFQLTSFLGRKNELVKISQLLQENPDCRLITLVGPGGIGKTRLSVEVATRASDAFKNGIAFVSLASVDGIEYVVSAIAEAIKLNFQGEIAPKKQLLHHLSQKSYLLILDNFEHLLSAPSLAEGRGCEELISEILQSAPFLKVIVTSRERLHLQEEWVFDIQGLTIPEESVALDDNAEALEHYPVTQLFIQRAQKGKLDFVATNENLKDIIRICRLVGGMPLGIELAAPWVRLMSCQEIADEIEKSFDFLETSLRNIPERHRNMRAILEQTWQMLSTEEQMVLSKLSVFRGGCLRDAAEVVARAGPTLLSSLVDKALLQHTDTGRFELHELIRQFAFEQLQRDSEIYTQTLDLHYLYYTNFLGQEGNGLKGGNQLETLQKITADIDNVQAAWQRAVDARDNEALDKAAEGFYLYSEFKGALAEGEIAFRQASILFEPKEIEDTLSDDSLRGYLLVGQGALLAHSGHLQKAQTLLEQGLTFLDSENDDKSLLQKRAFALMCLGWVLFLQAKNTRVENIAKESIAIYTEIKDQWGVAKNLYILGNSLTGSGRLADAEPLLRRSLAICQDIGDRRSCVLISWNLAILTFWFGDYVQTQQLLNYAAVLSREFNDQIGLALTLKELGKLEVAQGKYTQGIQTFHESITITDKIGSQWESAATLDDLGVALCLSGDFAAAENALNQCLDASQARKHRYFIARCIGNLGFLAYSKEDYRQAEKHLQDALDIWMELGHEPYRAWVLCQLGHVLQALGQDHYLESWQYYRKSLQLSIHHKLIPFVMDTFAGIARLLEVDEFQKTVELLNVAIDHPSSFYETKERARLILEKMGIDSTTELLNKSQQVSDWQVIADKLFEDISMA